MSTVRREIGEAWVESEADRALLRRFEPVIRYTRGEKFFPMDVERYIRACSLWMQPPEQEPICLVQEGHLTPERLAEVRDDGFGTVTYLKFIEPLNIKDLAAYTLTEGRKKKEPRDVFHPGRGRLARVGYTARFVDALFLITLLARGRVPGDTAAAAAQSYRRIQAENEHHCYYGRVVRQDKWIALQYWFFYPFNDWRSGFHGVNDHEADWEMIYVYLSETKDGEVKPAWVAYASHDFSGDDLRRRWDDPILNKVGEHPVVYAGAGSHASYYSHGEYLAELELPFLSPLIRFSDAVQFFSSRILRQARGSPTRRPEPIPFNIFRVPFVDYARGDGLSIGPGGNKPWDEPVLLDPPPGWAGEYRGLWGLYAHDPIAGENAPAGPVFNRDGTVRRSWYDPLGWAGLDKVAPPDEILAATIERCQEIETRQTSTMGQITEKSQQLVDLGTEAQALFGLAHMRKLYDQNQEKIRALSVEVSELRAQYASDSQLLEALQVQTERLRCGEQPPVDAHLQHTHLLISDTSPRLSWLAEVWSAISIGLILVSLVGIILFARHYLLLGLATMLSVMILIEAGFRRQLSRLIIVVSSALAIFSALLLIYEFFWSILIAAAILAGLYIIWENTKELRQGE